MKPYKIPSPLPLLLLLAAVIIIGLLSCSVAGKSKSAEKERIDSVRTSVHKDAEQAASDSSSQRKKAESEKASTTKLDSGSVHIEFDPADSIRNKKPVVIKQDSAGNVVIDPGERKLKSITDTRKRYNNHSSESTALKSDSVGVRKVIVKAGSDSSHSETRVIRSSSQSKAWHFNPSWLWWLAIPCAYLAYRFWPLIRKALHI